MINTMFLLDKEDNETNKSFNALNSYSLSSKRLSSSNRVKVNQEIVLKTLNTESFRISEGKINLHKANEIYCLEHIPGNVDVVLPKTKRLLDWVVLWYDQDRVIFNVSHEKHSKIKIYGNGSRIMGLDEPLLCDMPFMSLRLTYVNDIDGWIVT